MTALVLGGGGILGFAHLGAVQCLYDNGFKPSSVLGTSVGSVVAAILASGMEPKDCFDEIKRYKSSDILSFNYKFMITPGFFTLDPLRSFLKEKLAPKFKDTKIPLYVFATDSDRNRLLTYSSFSTPDIGVPLAVQASCSIPWLFRHTDIDGVRAVDGGLRKNLPIDVIKGPVVALKLMGSDDTWSKWSWWISYTKNMLCSFLGALEKEHIEDALFADVITIELPISAFSFHKLSPEMADTLYNIGYDRIKNRLKNGWKWL